MATIILSILISSVLNAQDSAEPPQLVDEQSIDEVIEAMALEEKAALVVGGNKEELLEVDDEIIGEQSTKIPGAAGQTQAIPRLGIPSIVLADGPMGVRIDPTRENDEQTYYATKFPSPNVLASSWDLELAREVGDATGSELRAYGIDLLLAPGMNIQAYLLNGRNYEYFSEDPIVTGKMASSMVKGVQQNGVGTTVKHFAVYNQRTNNNVDALVSQRAAREIYLRGFKIAVQEAHPWAVMDSYNKINGTWATENKELLTDVLRDDWGFSGFAMTDWEFGERDIPAQMRAGTNLLMPGREEQVEAIIESVENGKLEESVLDLRVKELLNIIVKTPTFNGWEPTNNPDLEKHARIARKAAVDGMVLLENKGNTLPLQDKRSVTLFGTPQIEIMTGGRGSALVHAANQTGIAEGLSKAGFWLNEEMHKKYRAYVERLRATEEYDTTGGGFFESTLPTLPEMDVSEEVGQAARQTDAGIIILASEHGSYGNDRSEEDFYISKSKRRMIENVSKAFRAEGKPVIAILNTEGPLEIESWKEHVDAILLAWQPGQEMGNAVADVLTGKVNPSGKLAQTFPKDYDDLPYSDRYPGDEKFVYKEDIYVGYRYHSTFDVEPAYEFGYGLSYTDFSYGDTELDKRVFEGRLTVDITVGNTGNTPGSEVVQLYISAPDSKLEKPVKELKAFDKTKILDPGSSQALRFVLKASDLASFDEKQSAWIIEKGEYEVLIGASSADIRSRAKFEVDEQVTVENVNDVLAPEQPIERLSKRK